MDVPWLVLPKGLGEGIVSSLGPTCTLCVQQNCWLLPRVALLWALWGSHSMKMGSSLETIPGLSPGILGVTLGPTCHLGLLASFCIRFAICPSEQVRLNCLGRSCSENLSLTPWWGFQTPPLLGVTPRGSGGSLPDTLTNYNGDQDIAGKSVLT